MAAVPESIYEGAARIGKPIPLTRMLLALDASFSQPGSAAMSILSNSLAAGGEPQARREIEAGREEVLAELRAAWERGAMPKGIPFINQVYALMMLHAGRDRYAAIAEQETIAFLRTIDPKLVLLAEDKTMTENGPDGLFLGGARALGLSRKHVGLEVKTVVSAASLGNTISKLKASLDGDLNGYRALARRHALAELKKMPAHAAAYREIDRSPDAAFGTVLVVRKCSNSAMNIPAYAREAFDVIIVFDVYGRLVQETTVSPNKVQLAKHVARFNDLRIRTFARSIHMDERILREMIKSQAS